MVIEIANRSKSTDWVLQFINIVFLLLVYFLVNGSIGDRIQTGIILPETAVAGPGLPPRNALFIDGRGNIYFAGRQPISTSLEEALASTSRDNVLIVAADRGLPAAELLVRLAELRNLGFLQMSILAVRGGGE